MGISVGLRIPVGWHFFVPQVLPAFETLCGDAAYAVELSAGSKKSLVRATNFQTS